MPRLLPILVATLAALSASGAQGQDRRLAQSPLPADVPYRDPNPRFRAPPPARLAPATATYTAQGYLPRPTNQPIFNEPPRPLR